MERCFLLFLRDWAQIRVKWFDLSSEHSQCQPLMVVPRARCLLLHSRRLQPPLPISAYSDSSNKRVYSLPIAAMRCICFVVVAAAAAADRRVAGRMLNGNQPREGERCRVIDDVADVADLADLALPPTRTSCSFVTADKFLQCGPSYAVESALRSVVVLSVSMSSRSSSTVCISAELVSTCISTVLTSFGAFSELLDLEVVNFHRGYICMCNPPEESEHCGANDDA